MIICWGISHACASVDERAPLVLSPEQRAEWLRHGMQHGIVELAILSTCNRTELYAVVPEEGGTAALTRALDALQLSALRVLHEKGYRHSDQAAVMHLFRVTSSLDSLVVGETQIAGQVKVAYQEGVAAGTIGPVLHRLFHKALHIAKQVREETGLGELPVSVASVAVALAEQLFGELTGCTALVIGAGEMGELTVRHLTQAGIGTLLIANRSAEKAAALATQFQGEAMPLTDLDHGLRRADIVICSAAGETPLLDRARLEPVQAARQGRPQFFIDIAIPRGLDDQIAALPDVYLYALDDLRDLAEANLAERKGVVGAAESIVSQAVAQFMAHLGSPEIRKTIAALHQKCEEIRREEVARTQLKLNGSGQEVGAALDVCTRAIVNRILHDPILQLKQSGHPAEEALPDAPPSAHHWLRRLFRLDISEI